jgi:hypothetical protein
LLTLTDRSTSSLGDGIPDSWRLRHFGSVSNAVAQANADPDGDGVPNWAEFQAGTDPMDPNSRLKVAAQGKGSTGLMLHWPTVAGKSYVVEAAASLTNPNWTVVGSGFTGTGQDLQFTPTTQDGSAQFYRVRLAQ